MAPVTLNMLSVCETFKSIQGESTHAGRVCSFIRLAGCNLACTYCDTRYAQGEGITLSIEEIMVEIDRLQCRLVELTGGEPLLQPETPQLCCRLLQQGCEVLVETNGSIDIGGLPNGCKRIVDVKCPDSGEGSSFLMVNLDRLNATDEVKFVISSHADFDWACAFVTRHAIDKRCTVIFSPNTAKVVARDLAGWIVTSNAPVRLGLQMHKIIWGDDVRGV
jgi:7-carboxy-7-deazaguanine synthase